MTEADPTVVAAITAAVQADPGNDALRLHLAELLLAGGDGHAALQHASRVLGTQPDHVGALAVAAAAAAAVGDEARAAAYQRLLAALDPGAAPAPAPAAPVPDPPLPREMVVPDTAAELFDEWSETEAIADVGTLHRPSVRLSDVGGMDDVKRRLELSFLAPMRNPELSLQFGKSLRGGLLLWGPPGCGKTFIARAVAGEIGANFYDVGLADVLDMWIGASERNLASIFETARRNKPCVLFFDEIDALGQKRTQLRSSGAMRGVVNQLLAELDGQSNDNDGVFVLAATNHPWDVDSALLRPGRFDRSILVLPPDQPARDAILTYHLRGRPTDDVDVNAIAQVTDGYSGADLSLICEHATETAMEASVQHDALRPITQHDLLNGTKQVRPSIGAWLDTARNFAMFNNDGGQYDDLLQYLNRRR